MTVQTITIQMPQAVFQRARRAAEVLHQPVEDVLADTLAATLPLLDDVPVDMAGEVAEMSQLSDEALQSLVASEMLPERQELLHTLLDEQGRGVLSDPQRAELSALMAEYGRHTLRRAKAMSLLIARGKPIPPLAQPQL